MKVLSSIGVLTLAGLILSSCDRVKQPIIKKNEAVGSNFVTNNNADVSSIKKILLEEYTGMRCPNCPDAANEAKKLSAQYTSSLIIISSHVIDLAEPKGAYASQIFKTDAGDVWASSSGFSIGFVPNGVINRRKYNNSITSTFTKWSSILSQAKNEPFIVKLNVVTNYDTVVKALNTSVKAIFRDSYSNPVNLTALIIEEGITGLQDVHGVDTPGYEFEHMMRGTLNGEWGQTLSQNAQNSDTVSVDINNFDLKGLKYSRLNYTLNLNDKNVYVVVYAYDVVTKEVLQVERVKLIK